MRSWVRTGSRGDHLVARNEASAVPPRSTKMPLRSTRFDDAGDELADAALVLVHDLRALGLTHLLDDDLLGGLRAIRPNATDSSGVST